MTNHMIMWPIWLSPIDVFQLGRSAVVCCACESHFLSSGITFEMCVKLSLESLQTHCVTYGNLWQVINTDTNWGDCSWPWQLLFFLRCAKPTFPCLRSVTGVFDFHKAFYSVKTQRQYIYIVNNTYFWLHVSVLSNRSHASIYYT